MESVSFIAAISQLQEHCKLGKNTLLHYYAFTNACYI